MTSREIIRALKTDGWVLRKSKGSHWHFTHPTKPGKVTVPHPEKDVPLGILRSIERQAQLTIRS